MKGLSPPFSFVWDSSILTKIDCRTNEKSRFLSLTLSNITSKRIVNKNSFLSFQSIANHVYWVAISSTNEKEREEKWRSLLNHITDVHVHKENEIFQRYTHGELDRAWIKAGYTVLHTF